MLWGVVSLLSLLCLPLLSPERTGWDPTSDYRDDSNLEVHLESSVGPAKADGDVVHSWKVVTSLRV